MQQAARSTHGCKRRRAFAVIHLLGFPLRQHLSNAIASRCHRQLARFGPNDGAMLLAEACALPGLIYPVWGADHYLRPEDRAEAVLIAILKSVTSPAWLSCAREEKLCIHPSRRDSRW